MKVWRIVKSEHAATAYTGIGSDKASARWHSAPNRIVYTASTAELAILEKLVYLRRVERLEGHVLVPAELDDSSIEQTPDYPVPFDKVPATLVTQSYGDAWLREQRSWGRLVPSALAPAHNVLLNPAHPRHANLTPDTPVQISRSLVTERAIA